MAFSFGRFLGSAARAAGPILDERAQRQALAERERLALEDRTRKRTLEDAMAERQRTQDAEAAKVRTLDMALKEEQLNRLRNPRGPETVNPGQAVQQPDGSYRVVVPETKTETPAQQAAKESRRASREDRLQQNYNQEPAVKQAGLLANAVAQLQASAAQKTPQGDLNMLYGAVKLRDPNAVREGELALNNKARALHTRLFSLWDNVTKGRILTDEERQQVMDLVDETVTQQRKLVEPVQARFGEQARQAGADSSFVAPDPFEGVGGKARSPQQKLWDDAVALHGRDKVLREFGPRP